MATAMWAGSPGAAGSGAGRRRPDLPAGMRHEVRPAEQGHEHAAVHEIAAGARGAAAASAAAHSSRAFASASAKRRSGGAVTAAVSSPVVLSSIDHCHLTAALPGH